MLSRSIVATTGLVLGFGCFVMATPAAAQSYTQQQQQLCSGDAFRLCGPEIPDVDRVTACMVRQRAQLSPGCRSVFRAPPAAIAPARAGRPTTIRPKAARISPKAKAAKSRKTPSSTN